MGERDRQSEVRRLRDCMVRVGRVAEREPTRDRIGFGLASIDQCFPGGGLAAGALHEMLGTGADTEHGVAASLLVAGLLTGAAARLPPDRQVLWAMRSNDLFPPGLAAVGLSPNRLILAECGNDVPAVMEEALRHPGLYAVVGEIEGAFGLTASRRLQLAAETSGVTAFVMRRSRRFDDPLLLAPSAAMTRWRVGVLPSTAQGRLLNDRQLWRLSLLRSRETSLFQWTVQSCDAEGRLADAAFPSQTNPRTASWSAPWSATTDRIPVPALLADRSLATERGLRRVG